MEIERRACGRLFHRAFEFASEPSARQLAVFIIKRYFFRACLRESDEIARKRFEKFPLREHFAGKDQRRRIDAERDDGGRPQRELPISARSVIKLNDHASEIKGQQNDKPENARNRFVQKRGGDRLRREKQKRKDARADEKRSRKNDRFAFGMSLEIRKREHRARRQNKIREKKRELPSANRDHAVINVKNRADGDRSRKKDLSCDQKKRGYEKRTDFPFFHTFII